MFAVAKLLATTLLLAGSSGLKYQSGGRRALLASYFGKEFNKLSAREQGALSQLSETCQKANAADGAQRSSAESVKALQACVKALQEYRKTEEEHRQKTENANSVYAENINTVREVIRTLQVENQLHTGNALNFVKDQEKDMTKLLNSLPQKGSSLSDLSEQAVPVSGLDHSDPVQEPLNAAGAPVLQAAQALPFDAFSEASEIERSSAELQEEEVENDTGATDDATNEELAGEDGHRDALSEGELAESESEADDDELD